MVSARRCFFPVLLCFLLPRQVGMAQGLSARIESGAVWFSRNEVRIPGDSGTRFSLRDLTGSGPDGVVRAHVEWAWGEKHAIRLLAAPLEVKGTGILRNETHFSGEFFSPDTLTLGVYRFDTYRVTYRRRIHVSEKGSWGIGAAVLVRDAEIRLRQGPVSTARTDTGLVPLLHVRGTRRIGNRTQIIFDAEGLGSPQGRALDVGLFLAHEPRPGLSLSAGYRSLEGGADNDSVYTFAWLHYAVLGIEYRF